MAIERRAFLRNAAVGTLALLPLPALAQDAVVTLVADPTDPVADSEPGRWAAGELRSAMRARGLDVQQAASVRSAPSGPGYRSCQHGRARDRRARRGTGPAGRSGSDAADAGDA
jgi:hypothetical protein